MKLSMEAPLVSVWTVWLVLVLAPVQEARSLSDAQIVSYLDAYLDKEKSEDALVPSRPEFFKKYTNGMVRAPGLKKVALKEVLETAIFVEHTSLQHGSVCTWAAHQEIGTSSRRRFYDLLNKVATGGLNGVRYCNFLTGYLRCEAEALHATCTCLPQMTWSHITGSCVFRKGEVCRGRHELDGVKFFHFKWATTEEGAEFVSSEVRAECERGTECTKRGICEPPRKHLLPLHDILTYFKGQLDKRRDSQGTLCSSHASDCQAHESLTVEIMRRVVSELKKPSSADLLQSLSLEIGGAKLLLQHGEACSKSLDLNFKLRDNTALVNPDWYSWHDHLRQSYLTELLDKEGSLCDPFRLLACHAGKCSCGPGRVHDPILTRCLVQNGGPCGPNLQTKEFQFRLGNGNPRGMSIELSMYHWAALECQNHNCEEIEHGIHFCTSEPAQHRFKLSPRFRLHIGERCNEQEQNAVFEDRTKEEPYESLKELQAHVAGLRNNSQIQFCQLTKHALCLKGVCSCIPPFVPHGTTCAPPLHAKCENVQELKKMKSDLLELTQLKLNIRKQDYLEILCSGELSCREASHWDIVRFCSCFNRLQHEKCSVEPGHHGNLIMTKQGLSEFMLSEEGQVKWADAHLTMSALQDLKTQEAGQYCDHEQDAQLQDLLLLFRRIEHEGCGSSSLCTLEGLRSIIEAGRKLVSGSGAACSRLKNYVCLQSICQCPPFSLEQWGECHLELGVACVDRSGELEQGLGLGCRTGTLCVNGYCQITGTSLAHNWRNRENIGEAYVMEIELLFLQFHRGRLTTALRERRLEVGGACSEEKEQAMVAYAEAIVPLVNRTDPSFTSSMPQKLQLIRFFQSFENNGLHLDSNMGPFCNPDSTCGAEGQCVSLMLPDSITEENSARLILPHILVYFIAPFLLSLYN